MEEIIKAQVTSYMQFMFVGETLALLNTDVGKEKTVPVRIVVRRTGMGCPTNEVGGYAIVFSHQCNRHHCCGPFVIISDCLLLSKNSKPLENSSPKTPLYLLEGLASGSCGL